MNKNLAGYVFAGETIFNIKMAGSVSQVLNQQPEPAAKPVTLPPPVVVEQTKTSPAGSAQSHEKLVLVVNNLSETEKDFLSKILQSVKQNLENAKILDLASAGSLKLSDYTSAKEIISFGVAMSKLSNDLLLFPYQSQEKESVKYLLVDDLKTIQANLKDEKRLLWAALKMFYGL
jgi:hypothetical protein